MKKSDAVVLAELEDRRELRRDLLKLLATPAFRMISGCAAVEMLQHVSIGTKPAEAGHFNWSFIDFGWHFPKPAEDIALLSQPLGTAIEAGIILAEIAPTLESVGKAIQSAGNVASLASLAALIPK